MYFFLQPPAQQMKHCAQGWYFKNNLTIVQPHMLLAHKYQVHIKVRVDNISNECEVVPSNQKPEEKQQWRFARIRSGSSYNSAEQVKTVVD